MALLFSLVFTAGVHAHDSISQTILKTYPKRQMQCLQEVAGAVDAATPYRGIALLFLGEDLENANDYLTVFAETDASLISISLFLRILLGYENQETLLLPETRAHVYNELHEFFVRKQKEAEDNDDGVRITESQEILQHTCYLLWAQCINNTTSDFTWSDQSTHDKKITEHQNALHAWIDVRLKYGMEDRSSLYYYYDMSALLTLRDYAQDERLYTKATALLNMLIADMAQENIQGEWGGVHCRSFDNLLPLPGNRLYYLFFDFPPSEEDDPGLDIATLHFSHSNFRPHIALIKLGVGEGKRESYEVKNRYCTNVNEPGDESIRYKYTYVAKNFMLGSFVLRGEAVPPQTRPWDLLLVEDGNPIHVFSFTGDQFFSGGRPPYQEEYYSWNTTCLQYKNVLFCRFHRSDRHQPAVGKAKARLERHYAQLPTRLFVPNILAPLHQEGDWWFCQYGQLYIALRPLTGRSYWWRTVALSELRETSAAIMAFQDLSPGFLLEVEEAGNFASFDIFKQQVQESPLQISSQSITYVSRRGDVFLFPFDEGNFIVNEHVMAPEADPAYQLYSSPYVNAVYGSGLFHAEIDGDVFSFNVNDF
jgi:hypothetical protein